VYSHHHEWRLEEIAKASAIRNRLAKGDNLFVADLDGAAGQD